MFSVFSKFFIKGFVLVFNVEGKTWAVKVKKWETERRKCTKGRGGDWEKMMDFITWYTFVPTDYQKDP